MFGDEFSTFVEVAQYLQHPLVLVGFGVFVVFGFYHALLKAGILPPVSRTTGNRVVVLLVRHGFLLPLVLMLPGFGPESYREHRGEQAARDLVAAVAAAEAQLKADYEEQIAGLELHQSASQETIESLNAAVRALAREAEDQDAPPGVEEALSRLAEGETAEAEAIFREMAARKEAEGAAADREAAAAYRHLGVLASLSSTREAIAAYRQAATLDPYHVPNWIELGRLEQRAGDLSAAQDAFTIALEVARRSGASRMEMATLSDLGDVELTQGDLAAALASYRAALAIAERLAAQDPDNAGRQRDLSVSHEKIGDVELAQGDLAGALASYRAALGIAERLAAQDPGNAGWQRDLSVSHLKVGDVEVAQGDLAGALASYRAALGIAERLAAQDPGNAGWQRDLIVSYVKIADVNALQKSPEGRQLATQHYEAALWIINSLIADGRLAPRDHWMKADFERRLSDLSTRPD